MNNTNNEIDAQKIKEVVDSMPKSSNNVMSPEQCMMLEEYEKDIKKLREEVERLKKVEEQKIQLEEDVKRVQGVHSQMDTIITDLKNKAKLTDQ